MTISLGQPPFWFFMDPNNSGSPAANFQVFTYIAGSSTKQATWTDSSQVTQNANPLRLDANGAGVFWGDPTTPYKIVLAGPNDTDPPSSPLRTIDNMYFPLSAQQGVALQYYPRTQAEINVGVTPVNYTYPDEDPRRYGAVGDGATDDTVALTNWAKPGGRKILPALTFLISNAIPLPSYTTVYGTTGAIVLTSTQNISQFSCTSVTGVSIRNIHFKQTGSYGSTAYTIGQVLFNLATFCNVEGCIFEAPQWSGVTILASTNCTARNNYFTGFTSLLQDQSDIAIISSASQASAFNVAEGNFCYGGGEHGISVQDPYAGVLPSRNVVANNRIGAHTGYGVLVYMPDAGDSFNQVIGNHIEGITGSFASNPSSGTGIYVSGAGCGGTIVANNQVRNCCINTANATLAPAGIGVNGLPSGGMPIVISGNLIEGMTQYWGILMTGCAGGGTVTANTIRMPATQGANIGGAIRITNSSNIEVATNTIVLLTTTQNQDGISVFGQTSNSTNIAITGNTITGGHANQIRVGQLTSGTVTGVTITGNICTGGDSSCIPCSIDSAPAATRVNIEGNQFAATGSVAALSIGAVTTGRFANNALSNGGGSLFVTAGSCTSCSFVHGQINAGQISNAATGVICETLQTAVPASGTYAVGDVVRNSTPTVGGVLFWVCTTAGTGGGTAVFKSVSNT